MRKRSVTLLGILLLLSLTGCWEFDPKTPPPPPPPPKVDFPEPIIPTQQSKGSLFREGSSLFAYADNRARFVGDLITIKILENYQSTNNVKQGSSKSSSIRAGINSVFGYEKQFEKTLPLPSGFDPTKLVDASMSSSTSGQGQTQRESRILATISARVVEVLPNGNLVVQGVRTIKRNRDLEYITITGIVRPQDVESDNSVISTKLSDLYIEYSGKGPSSEAASGPGILTRLLQLFWLF
ncbi:MAG: flagellar basal body L-ring protein FlgH [Caldimicrobium sp.]|nr:flagellar basal body L-ring protein FlgH [Caldimicrobium sp.]MCX7613884.1 flagellar basal body L-ring protein FlgH [Caldimicrobium sp.]MDW8183434.1 flagellar basal body L-ring protein FlgH [Caldimicrobium sp.]